MLLLTLAVSNAKIRIAICTKVNNAMLTLALLINWTMQVRQMSNLIEFDKETGKLSIKISQPNYNCHINWSFCLSLTFWAAA